MSESKADSAPRLRDRADLAERLKGLDESGPRNPVEKAVGLKSGARVRRAGRLILTCGLPYSGKTSWARAQSVPIVNPDSVRRALHGERFLDAAEPWVWVIAKTMVRALFEAGHSSVIVDATHVSRKRRDFWRDEGWHVSVAVFEASAQECVRRALEQGDPEIVPVIERMAREFEYPSDERLWHLDHVVVI